MRPHCRAIPVAPMLALALLAAAPAHAGTESSACRSEVTTASTGMTETRGRLKSLAKVRGEEKCAVYRAQFLAVVKARAVLANCKTGPDRAEEVERLDGTIEDLNGAIAESCAIQ